MLRRSDGIVRDLDACLEHYFLYIVIAQE